MAHARKHHYLPQFYLKGFTDTGEVAGTLYVLDRSKKRSWRTTPANAAHQRDLYAVKSHGKVDPGALEKIFSGLESQFAPILQQVIDRRELPQGAEKNLLLNFLTLMAIRVPQMKEAMEDMNDAFHKAVIRQKISTPQGWNAFTQSIKDAGGDLSGDKLEKLREFINSDAYRITQGQNWYVSMIADASKTVLPLLAARKWVLRQVEEDASDLVCSDIPVTVNLRGNYANTKFMPGFGHSDALVMFPVNKRSAMIGAFENDLLTSPFTRKGVANLNSATARPANQVYSSTPDYVCLLKDGSIGTGADILTAWKRSPKVK